MVDLHHSRSRARLVGLALTLGLALPSAEAQNAAHFNEALSLMCPGIALKLTNAPELTLALKRRPIDLEAVCRCTLTAFEADTSMQALMTGEQSVVQKRMSSPEVKSYFVLRLTRSILGCVLPEYDAALAAGPPTP